MPCHSDRQTAHSFWLRAWDLQAWVQGVSTTTTIERFSCVSFFFRLEECKVCGSWQESSQWRPWTMSRWREITSSQPILYVAGHLKPTLQHYHLLAGKVHFGNHTSFWANDNQQSHLDVKSRKLTKDYFKKKNHLNASITDKLHNSSDKYKCT